MKDKYRTFAAAAFLLACTILGGASAAGTIVNAILQILAAMILLALLIGNRLDRPVGRIFWAAAFALTLLAIIQLLPLPPSLWAALPGRAAVADGFAAIGRPLPWLSISLTPERTIASLLAVLVPLAFFYLLAPPTVGQATLWPLLIVAIALLQLAVGMAQLSGGRDSHLYFYAFTNWGNTVGFFANSNHQVTALLIALPFVAALATSMLSRPNQPHDMTAKVIIMALFFVIIAGGVALNGSRLGLLLLPVILALCGAMIGMDLSCRRPRLWPALASAALVGGGLIMTGHILLARDQGDAVSETGRAAYWAKTWPLVGEYFPAGSGLGSFAQVYQLAEDPLDRPRTYANHAHNDYLEWALETGVTGLLLLAAFLAWFGRRSWLAWTDPGASFARAASVGVATILIHSLVDYPLRTAAIAALFGICCAMLASPWHSGPIRKWPHKRDSSGIPTSKSKYLLPAGSKKSIASWR